MRVTCRFVTDVMRGESWDNNAEETVIEEISGIIYHKSKILLKAITRKDKNKWFDQLMIKKPNREQVQFIDQIVECFDRLLVEYREIGHADEKKIQEIGRLILKAPEMIGQIGKLIAHILQSLEDSEAKIEQTLDSSIKKDYNNIAKKQEKAQAMAALEAHLREESSQAGPRVVSGDSKFESFKNRFHPQQSVINEDRGEDQEDASTHTQDNQYSDHHHTENQQFNNTFKCNYDTSSYYDSEHNDDFMLKDPLLNPGIEHLDIYNDDNDYDDN